LGLHGDRSLARNQRCEDGGKFDDDGCQGLSPQQP
jgi:hypothetical protein